MTRRPYLLPSLLACVVATALATPAFALPRVAVLAASTNGSDVKTKLQATNAFQVVDFINVNTSTPTVAQLQTYDAVIVYSQQAFMDANTLGDNLATYVDGGGGVVLGTWGSLEQSSIGLGGRYAITYTLMTAQTANLIATTNSTFGQIVEMGSALIAGVTKFTCKTTCHHLTSAIKPAGVVVARWADGNPLIVRGAIGGHNVVELNFLPASATIAGGEWDATTDGALIMKNALLYVVGNPIRANVATLNFLPVGLGQSAVQTITYTNGGAATATVSQLGLAGANAADFTLFPSKSLPAKVPAGGTLEVGVLFTPPAIGARSATVQALVAGSPGTIDVTLTGTGAAKGLTVAPTVVAFGGTAVNNTLRKTFTITNNTGVVQTLGSSSVTLNAAEFTATPTFALPVTLPDQSSFDFNVTFTPLGNGGHVGAVTVAVMGGANIQIPFTGSAGDPALLLGNGSLVFGNTHVGASSTPQTITLVNNGYTDLHVSAMLMAGANAADFLLTSPKLPLTLAPGAQSSCQVAFTPMAAGTRNAFVTVISDDPSSPTATLAVSGQSFTYGEMIAPAVPMDFGMIKSGSTSMPQTATLTNTSRAPLLVKKVLISGPGAAAFSMQNPPADNTTVAAMAALAVRVVFKPVNAATYNATLTFLLDDPNLPSATVSLTGQGTAGVATVTPLTLDFGGVSVGNPSTAKSITIGNAGGAPLVISAFTVGGVDQAAFTMPTPPAVPATIMPGSMTTLDVVFTPSAHAAQVANLIIETDDPLAPMITVSLKGLGTQAKLAFDPKTIDFGVTLVGAPTDPVTATLSNTGDEPLALSAIQIQGAAAGEFRIEANPAPVTLDPGSSTTVTVRFNPTRAATANAQLAITPRDTMITGGSIALKGIGVTTAVSLLPATVDFGVVDVGGASPPEVVTVRNISGGQITLTPIQSSNPVFLIDTTATTLTLAAGGTTTFNVIFSPTAGGVVDAKADLFLAAAPTRAIGTVAFTGEGAAKSNPNAPSRTGCALAGRRGTGPAWAPLGLAFGLFALVALRRRRRSR